MRGLVETGWRKNILFFLDWGLRMRLGAGLGIGMIGAAVILGGAQEAQAEATKAVVEYVGSIGDDDRYLYVEGLLEGTVPRESGMGNFRALQLDLSQERKCGPGGRRRSQLCAAVLVRFCM